MSGILTGLMAAVPNAGVAIVSKLFSEKFVQMLLEKILIFGLTKLAKLSTNTVDDAIVADIVKQLKA